MEGEEKSLDDFFAKKDKGKKGKSKGKGKFTTSSAITKQVENSQKTVTEQSKEQKPSSSHTSSSQNEDEWVDFNEPKEKDYSGLKVQSLQTRDKADDEADEGTGMNDEFDGGDSTEKEKASSVWQSVSQPTPQAIVEAPKEEVKKEVKGVYVPPSMRGASGNASDVKDQSWKYGAGRRDVRRPPEIASEIAFPSLQTTADVSTKSEAKATMKFETVKHGARTTTEQSINRRTNIDIGNKYDALSK